MALLRTRAILPCVRPLGFLDERESLAQEAAEMRRLGPAERVELFCSIMRMVETVWATLPAAEQWRRLRLAEQIDGPRPEPWWMGVRSEARP